MNKLGLSIALSSITLCASSVAISAPNFIDLEAKFGSNITVSSINDNGQISGITWGVIGTHTATVFDGENKSLMSSSSYLISSPVTAINNLGQVVATIRSHESDQIMNSHAGIWNGSNWTDLGTLGGHQSEARDINDSGFVVGVATTDRGTGFNQTRATVWDNNGVATNLKSLPGGFTNEANAINNNGYIVGATYGGDTPGSHAVIWNPSGGITKLDNLDTQANSNAIDINESNQVIGYSYGGFDGVYHATLWNGTNITDLGSLNGLNTYAFAINDDGYVVGSSLMNVFHTSSLSHAFIRDKDNGMIDLNKYLSNDLINEGWVLTGAFDINNHGSILSGAFNTNTNESTTFLISSISPVPEPSTYAMLLAGLGIIGFMIRCSRSVI